MGRWLNRLTLRHLEALGEEQGQEEGVHSEDLHRRVHQVHCSSVFGFIFMLCFQVLCLEAIATAPSLSELLLTDYIKFILL